MSSRENLIHISNLNVYISYSVLPDNMSKITLTFPNGGTKKLTESLAQENATYYLQRSIKDQDSKDNDGKNFYDGVTLDKGVKFNDFDVKITNDNPYVIDISTKSPISKEQMVSVGAQFAYLLLPHNFRE